MDMVATKAAFARTAESHRILAEMRAEARLNRVAIDKSRKAIHESRDILNHPGDGQDF